MKKYTIQSKKGKTSIIEVEIEVVKQLEDPSVGWMNTGEYKARILKPTSFHQKLEKIVDGKSELTIVPDVLCWHAFYSTLEEAKAYSEELIKHEFKFMLRKHNVAYTEEDVQAAIAAVEVLALKA
jgi:hypothetical protein